MKIIDISQEVFGCAVYPGDPKPEKKTMMQISEGAVCNLSAFSMCAHNGTHVDARCILSTAEKASTGWPWTGLSGTLMWPRMREISWRRMRNGSWRRLRKAIPGRRKGFW